MARSPLVDVAWGYMPAQIIHAAAELELADALASGPRSSNELAVQSGTHEMSLRRLLRALVTLGVVTQSGPDRFELTELGGHLRKDSPETVRSIVLFLCSAGPWSSWNDVLYSLRTGEPAFTRNYGMHAFEYLAQHPDEAEKLNGAMGQMTRETAAGLIAGYDFSRFQTVVDVGGGNGTFLAEVLRRAPGVNGVVFDMPTGAAEAPATLELAGVGDRCSVVTGSFFGTLPAGADAYVMKLVLHDWSDEKALAILRNCRTAIAPGGRLLVFERLVPDVVTPDLQRALLADMLMLVLTGGRERSEAEYRDLFAEAGFTLTSATGPLTALGFTLLEGVPASGDSDEDAPGVNP